MTASVRPSRTLDLRAAAAFLLYLFLAWMFVGRALGGHLASAFIGKSNDPATYMWFLTWWPYAARHLLNPFITPMLWAPNGFNLAWTTPMPLAAILAAPLTLSLGAVASYNILCILALALAAWTCFVLCCEVTENFGAALAGGYVFGFSAYMLAEARAHLVLLLVFPIPLALLVVLRLLRQRLSPRAATIALAAVLAAQAWFEIELFATLTFFGAVALALAAWLGDHDLRRRLHAAAIPIARAYAMVIVLILPYLWFFFQPGFPRKPVNSPAAFSSDLLNFFVPTPVNQLGTLHFLTAISRHFAGSITETPAHIGLPLILACVLFARMRWATTGGSIVLSFLAFTLVATLGPRLHVAGVTLIGMPWKLATHLPLLNNTLPSRFMIFAFLALALITAQWLAAAKAGAAAKTALILAAALFLCPNLDGGYWITPTGTPAFFLNGQYRNYLAPGENVIALPYSLNGRSMLWQAETRMYFRMAGGWTSITPREFAAWPIVNAFTTSAYIPDAPVQLLAFMAAHQVGAVIVDDRSHYFWAEMLSGIDQSPVHVGRVRLYRPSAAALAAARSATAIAMERRCDEARFAALLAAARAYLAQGRDPALLTPLIAARLDLLPRNWVDDPDVRTHSGLYLGPWPGGKIAIGVVGTYDALRPLISAYRTRAAAVLFPFPRQLTDPPYGDTFMRQLVIVFDRAAVEGPP